MNEQETNDKKSRWQKLKFRYFGDKKKTVVTILTLVIVLAILSIAGYTIYKRYLSPEKSNPISNLFKQEEVNKTAVSVLDGTEVDESKANRHPLAIIVENHPDSRPHSGLDKASIVYEAIAEGGITRFMAIFGPHDADRVGPVRSARTYFLDWASEYNAFFAHVGGNLDALEKIKTDKIYDLDQFALGTKAYWREPQAGKAVEHTMYTSTEKLYENAFSKNWPKEIQNFEAYSFKKPLDIANRPGTQELTIDFSSESYKVNWIYDRNSNTYMRSLAGSPHKDKITGNQLEASNIIIQEVERWDAPTRINESGWAMKTIGSGNAKIYMEGKETKATWKKISRTSRTLFYDEKGNEIKFVPGKFWIEITPPEVFSKIK